MNFGLKWKEFVTCLKLKILKNHFLTIELHSDECHIVRSFVLNHCLHSSRIRIETKNNSTV